MTDALKRVKVLRSAIASLETEVATLLGQEPQIVTKVFGNGYTESLVIPLGEYPYTVFMENINPVKGHLSERDSDEVVIIYDPIAVGPPNKVASLVTGEHISGTVIFIPKEMWKQWEENNTYRGQI